MPYSPRNPSDADIDASLSLLGGRLSVACNEVLRLLRDNAPAQVARKATELGIDIAPPENFFLDPGDLSDITLNTVLVGFSTRYQTESPRTLKKVTRIMIFWVQEAAVTGMQSAIDARYDGGDILAAILHPYINGQNDPYGRKAWNHLIAASAEMLPNWRQYSGPLIGFELHQFPGNNSWDAVS